MVEIQEDIPLGSYTTFGIGGPTRFFVEIKTIEEVEEALTYAERKKLPVFILGGGSNTLVHDDGWEGLVIKISLKGITEESGLLIAGAGEPWDHFVQESITRGLWGVENLSGIPGSVGGAVVQNIGAYGEALSQTLAWVEVYDPKENAVRRVGKEECTFGYRDSVFKTERDLIILRAAFTLSPVATPHLSYKDLLLAFEGTRPTLGRIRTEVLKIRAQKFPDVHTEGTAGSFFKNPLVGESEARILVKRYAEMPVFPMPETEKIKIPLAWLLDKKLSMRGYREGAVRAFERQTLVIVADRGATARSVRLFAKNIRDRVRKEFGIVIEPEVCVLERDSYAKGL